MKSEEVREEIKVIVKAEEYPQPLTYKAWGDYLFDKLSKAGMPIARDGAVLEGEIEKYDDPEDFCTIVYIWRPKNENI